MSKEIPEGREITGSIAKEMDSRFLNRRYFIGNGTIGLTIKKIESHAVLEYENGDKKENAILCFFEETPKPLDLCNTNIDSIIAVTGSGIGNDWKGKKVGFKAVKGKWFGKEQFAVRVDEKYKEKK